MSAPLLQTKIHKPQPRPNLVRRPRLIDRLEDGLWESGDFRRSLTLISAPPGFGKTTLASDWLSRSLHSIAWLSLGEGDNDLSLFLNYIIAALQSVDSNLGEGTLGMLQSAQELPSEMILTALINEIAARPTELLDRSRPEPVDGIILALDDYHVVSSSAIHNAVAFLLEHMPRAFHLVLISRVDPPIQLSRLRASGEMIELRSKELRFRESETAAFLNQSMSLDLSSEQIEALERRTEGWIAALHLAALSLQGREDKAAFVSSFSGSHHYVMEYLVDEVFAVQPEQVRSFLIHTSVLRRFCASLCNAILDVSNSQDILQDLQEANLFLIPLDDDRQWFRYHHLFSDFLAQRLQLRSPEIVPELHIRASSWLEENEYLDEAIDHAFAAGEYAVAARQVEAGANRALKYGQLRSFLGRIRMLPADVFHSRPWLGIYHAWALILSAQVQAAQSQIDATERWLAASSPDPATEREMMGHVAGIRAAFALWERDLPRAARYASQAVELIPKDHWVRGHCAGLMGYADLVNGNLGEASRAFSESLSIGTKSENRFLAVSSACNVGYMEELQGRLGGARAIYQEARSLAAQSEARLPVGGFACVDLARVVYELNELDAANLLLEEGIALCKMLADRRAQKIGYYLQARVRMAQGNLAGAGDLIRKAEQVDPRPDLTFDLRGGEHCRVWLWLIEGNVEAAFKWALKHGLDPQAAPTMEMKLRFTMHARALIHRGREEPARSHLDDALRLLEQLLELAETKGWRRKVIEALVLQSLAWQAHGESEMALSTLAHALSLGESQGFIRTFINEGEPMRRLLRLAFDRGIAKSYVSRLLVALGPTKERGTPIHQLIVDPLTERELEVLHLLATELSGPEIAQELSVSLNTLRTHTKSIYGKLGVRNRRAAVGRARDQEVI